MSGCLLLINLLTRMIQTPIHRKKTHYPKDFIPNAAKTTHPKRFTFHQDYQIEIKSIKKYQKEIEEQPNPIINTPLTQIIQTNQEHYINPQMNILICNQLQQESPLLYHSSKKPNLDQQLLKKPRFTMLDKAELAQQECNQLQNSTSPGSIKKQLEGRQVPLPVSEPCIIDLLISHNQVNKLSSSIIKYKSSGQFMANKWKSTEKDIVSSFKASHSKIDGVTHLPKVVKQQIHDLEMFQSAKQQYQRFRKRQQSLGSSYSKVNNLLSSMHRKQSKPITVDLAVPQFQPNAVQKLKQEINKLVLNKVGRHKQDKNYQEQSSQEETEQLTVRESRKQHSRVKIINGRKADGINKKPQLLVSYRSSLCYLKDLYSQASQLNSYHLVLKIPKIFTEKLIFRQQQKQQLYQAARGIFEQLRIDCQNLVIKRYTNCTMIVARTICLIWHFDGKRYLGGWQSEYLDQGFKHGLGLEWQPKSYVYYGQFVKNKKHGLGIYKDRHQNSYVGYWSRGRKASQQQLCEQEQEQQEQGWILEQEQEQSGQQRAFEYV